MNAKYNPIHWILTFIEDWVVFFKAGFLLCKSDPFLEDHIAEENRYTEILERITAEYKADLEKDHEPNEIEEQMMLSKETLKAKARVLAHDFEGREPTPTEKLFKRFHEAQSRLYKYILGAWFLLFAILFIDGLFRWLTK